MKLLVHKNGSWNSLTFKLGSAIKVELNEVTDLGIMEALSNVHIKSNQRVAVVLKNSGIHDRANINGKLTELAPLIEKAQAVKAGWLHPDYAMRLIAPESLLSEHVDMLVELAVNRKLPTEKVDNNFHIYMNEVQQQDAALVDQLQGVITIQSIADVINPEPEPIPDASWTNQQIKDWLTERDIYFAQSWTKAQLLEAAGV